VNAETLLVRLPNWLGDALLARPLLHALRAARPRDRIAAVGPAALLELLAADQVFDLALEAGPDRGALARRVRALEPGAAIVLPGSFSSAWLAFRSGARVRIGFRGEGRAPLLTRALPRGPRGSLHLSREFLELGRVLGAAAVATPPLVVGADAVEKATALLERIGVRKDERVALLGPRSAFGPAREWPAERFAVVGRALGARARVLVCGTAAERASCEAVARSAGDGALSIAGETDLPTLAALARRALVAVCNDSGLAHLAAAVGAPTIQIYGSAGSAWTRALGDRVRIVQRAPVCSPCYQRNCRIGTRCLTAISAGEILRAVDEIAA